jgi:hypothetical protein
MKTIYLSSSDTKFIYEHLKSQGYYEWYIILRCVEEIQCDYTFLSRLSWNNLLREREKLLMLVEQKIRYMKSRKQLKMKLEMLLRY